MGHYTYTIFSLLILLAACSGREKPQEVARTVAIPQVYTVPAGIDRTGATDVTDTLNAWIATVPDSAIISFRANSTYRAEGGIHFRNRRALEVRGNGARIWSKWSGDSATVTLIANPPGEPYSLYRVQLADGAVFDMKAKNVEQIRRNRYHVNIEGCTGVNVTGIYIDGPNDAGGPDGLYIADQEAQHGFNISASHGVNIKSSRVMQVWGDCFCVSSGCSGISIENNICQQTGRHGVAITNADSVVIAGNLIEQIRRSSIDLEPLVVGWTLKNVSIDGNLFGSARLTWIAAAGKGGTFENVRIENNIVLPGGVNPNIILGSGDTTARRGPITVRGNYCLMPHGTPQGASWRFSYVDGLTVEGNYVPLQTTRAMYLTSCLSVTGATVQDNTFPGGLGNVIYPQHGQLGGSYTVQPINDTWTFRQDGILCTNKGGEPDCAVSWRMSGGYLYIAGTPIPIVYDWKKQEYRFTYAGAPQVMKPIM